MTITCRARLLLGGCLLLFILGAVIGLSRLILREGRRGQEQRSRQHDGCEDGGTEFLKSTTGLHRHTSIVSCTLHKCYGLPEWQPGLQGDSTRRAEMKHCPNRTRRLVTHPSSQSSNGMRRVVRALPDLGCR